MVPVSQKDGRAEFRNLTSPDTSAPLPGAVRRSAWGEEAVRFAQAEPARGLGATVVDVQDPAAPADAELLAALAGGDLGAMRMLYDRHAPWLAARLNRRCNSPDAVAAVLQDTFVALWKGGERWRGDGEVGAWLWGIAVRRLVSRLRGRREALVLPAEEVAAARPVEPGAYGIPQALPGN